MTAQLVVLNANRALCAGRIQIAERLEELAQRIRALDDHQDPLQRVMVILDHPRSTAVHVYGQVTPRVHAVGMLEYAKDALMRGLDAD